MEEPSEIGPRSKRMRLEAEEAERAPLSSLAREEILARCNVGTSRGIVPETRSVSNSIQRYHVVSHALTVRRVECRDAWMSILTKEEKLYGHHFGLAAWAGARICAYQSSQESPAILSMLCLVFSGEPVGALEKRSYAAGITEREWKYLGAFAACFFTNMGNYLAFGGTKFIPGIPEQKLALIINLCTLEGEKKERLMEIWNSTKDKIYSLKEDERQLGIPPRGTSMYYHPSIRAKDIDLVQEWMAQDGVEGWNTRIWRNEDEMERNDLPLFQLRVASSLILPTEVYTYQDKCMIEVVYGDFKEQIEEVVEHLERAYEFANGPQKDMIIEFIEYFKTGSVDAHKRAQKQWVSVKDLSIESNIGFMETYRDPTGIRAEFEGFVATVDKVCDDCYGEGKRVKELVNTKSALFKYALKKSAHLLPGPSSLYIMGSDQQLRNMLWDLSWSRLSDKSAKYALLVAVAEEVLRTLPWPKEFEKDVFHVPQFSSLTMISFANSSIPVGINLPNYEEIRQEYGFKNVVLHNILSAHEDVGKVTFLEDGDQDVFEKHMQAALHIQIACHELLGHGSGKIFKKKDDGTYNYKHGEVMHPFTSEPVVKCYAPGQTFDSVFGSLSSTFEECRADCVGLYLSANALVLIETLLISSGEKTGPEFGGRGVVNSGLIPRVLEIFGHTGADAEDVVYVNWLLMVRAGLVALEFFNQKTGNWSQPHMQARFAILRVLLKASEAEMEQSESSDGSYSAPFLQLISQESDVMLSLNRSKVHTVGMPALGEFLTHIQVYKSTADVDSARSMFTEICEVPDPLLALRRIVLVRKRPRPLLVQVTTALDDSCEEGVRLKDYPATFEGIIESFVERFQECVLNR